MATKKSGQGARPGVQGSGLVGGERRDHIEHGSEQHAAMIGLRRAGGEDTYQVDGWTLADITAFGPAARPEFLEQVLRQKVAVLTSPVPVLQSDDPNAPNYAPPMWMPPEGGATGIV